MNDAGGFGADDSSMLLAPPRQPSTDTESADARAAWAATAEPGPEVAAVLAGLDRSQLSEGGRLDAMVAVERQQRWLSAMQHHLIAAHVPDPSRTDDLEQRFAIDEISCALAVSRPVAESRAHESHTLTTLLPDALTMLERGQAGAFQVHLLIESVYSLSSTAAAAVQAAVLPHLATSTPGQLRRRLNRAVLAADPDRAEQSLAEGRLERRVACRPSGPGMAELWALLPAEGASAVMAAVNSLASVTSADDDRTIDQRRADALVDLGVAVLHDPAAPRAQGLRPAVGVTVALSTLLGQDDQPGDLRGFGPVPASVARRLAADPSGSWRRLVTDPLTGQLLDYGTTTYRPPADLARFVIARDQTCTFPTCRQPAQRCDLDHLVPADPTEPSRGGSTSPANLHPLCRAHHRAKHAGYWRVDRDQQSGRTTWTSRIGHSYTTVPPPVP
jgi:hypothetical protein